MKRLMTFKARYVDGQWEVWARVRRPKNQEDVYFMVCTGLTRSEAMSEALVVMDEQILAGLGRY